MNDVQKLKDEGRAAAARGKHHTAAELYTKVAELEHDPSWLHRAGEAYLRAGERAAALRLLVRAASAYGKQGALLKGIAVCTRILDLDSEHTTTQELLAGLYAMRDAPARPGLIMPPPLPRDAPAAAPWSALSPSPRPLAAAEDGTLDEISLASTMPSVRMAWQFPAATIPLGEHLPAQLAQGLHHIPLFSSLDERRLRRLIHRTTRVDVQPGEVVIRQGEAAGEVFVIAHGAVEVFADVDGQRSFLYELTESDFFGELGVMTASTHMTTVIATVETQLLRIDRPTVVELFREDSEVRRMLLRFFRDRLLRHLMTTSAVFRPFSGAAAQTFAARFELLEFEAGAALITEGEPSPALFILLCGQCDVTRRIGTQELWIDTSGPGAVCGEMSIVASTPAAGATVRAKTRVWALAMSHRTASEVLREYPEVLEQLRKIAAERRRAAHAPDAPAHA